VFISKNFFIFSFTLYLLVVNSGASASQESLDSALRSTYTACVGINDKLTELKKMAGINTAISSVGTAVATGALATGIAKAQKDKEIQELIKKILEKEQVTSAPETNYEKLHTEFYNNYEKMIQNSDDDGLKLQELNEKSKKLGNWRTGLMAGSTATNVAGAIIANKNNNDNSELNDMIARCLDMVSKLDKEIGQAHFDGIDTSEAKSILSACREYNTVDLSKITKRNTGAMVSSIVGASAGTIGTITSAVANSDSIRQGQNTKKDKGLNTASNVLAGTTVVASGTATVFNATQIAAIKHIATVAENCEGLLKQ
jgi:hypothetical protein